MQQPKSYKGKQAIIRSGRILIVANDNDVFINSKESISLSTNKTINLDSNKHTIINSPNIYLGLKSIDKSQPISRGEDVRNILSSLIDSLDQLINLIEKNPTEINPALMLGFSYVKGTIDTIKETYGKDLAKSLSTKTYVE